MTDAVDLPYDPLYDAADDLRHRVQHVQAAITHFPSLFHQLDRLEDSLETIKQAAIALVEVVQQSPPSYIDNLPGEIREKVNQGGIHFGFLRGETETITEALSKVAGTGAKVLQGIAG